MVHNHFSVNYIDLTTGKERTKVFNNQRDAEEFIRNTRNGSDPNSIWIECNFKLTWRARHPHMFNVDRWTTYTRQKLMNQGYYSKIWEGRYFDMTPKQIRRCKKKMRKNGDTSIGVC